MLAQVFLFCLQLFCVRIKFRQIKPIKYSIANVNDRFTTQCVRGMLYDFDVLSIMTLDHINRRQKDSVAFCINYWVCREPYVKKLSCYKCSIDLTAMCCYKTFSTETVSFLTIFPDYVNDHRRANILINLLGIIPLFEDFFDAPPVLSSLF